MGACVSSHQKSSNQKLDNHVVILSSSPVKEKLPIIDGNVAVKPQWPPLHLTANSPNFGSKEEEMFFDSQAWLESDCESDFMSVNGEFTPSRNNTPVHRNIPVGTSPINGGAPAIDHHKPSFTVSQPISSPIKKKKRLSELFSESPRENCNRVEENCENGVVGRLEAAAVHGGVLKSKRERWVEIVQVHGCLPRVLSSCRPVTHQQNRSKKKISLSLCWK